MVIAEVRANNMQHIVGVTHILKVQQQQKPNKAREERRLEKVSDLEGQA